MKRTDCAVILAGIVLVSLVGTAESEDVMRDSPTGDDATGASSQMAGSRNVGSEASNSASLPEFDTLWDFQQPDTTEARFRSLLPEARASGDIGYLVELLSQIARTEGLQRRFEDAHRTLDEAEGLLRDGLSRARVRVLLERGRVYNSSGDPAKAGPLFHTAWDLALESGGDALAVDAAHMVAIVASPEEAILWNEKAMELAQDSSDPKARRWLGSLYNNLGWTYHDKGEFEKALDLFRRAYDWRVEQGQEREIRIAKWCVARTLRSLDRTEEALRMQEELLAEWEAAGGSDGYVNEELAECLLVLGREDEARPQFRRAHELLSQDPWMVANEAGRLERLKELGGER